MKTSSPYIVTSTTASWWQRWLRQPPANSDTPFKDVVDLRIAIARVKGLDATNAEAAGRIRLFFAETNGKPAQI